MGDDAIVGLTTIVVLGVGAQWIGRRVGFPSLLLLLPAGMIAGDGLGLVDPEALFGETLFPLVTLLVSLLLFQSAQQLRLADLPREARGPVLRLNTVGALITFIGATTAMFAATIGTASEISGVRRPVVSTSLRLRTSLRCGTRSTSSNVRAVGRSA